jgi:uncharacterized damage-inducible protein DinB
MIDAHYSKVMANYNAWMNGKLYVTCAEISDVERKRDRGAFFKSIHGTLNHLLLADRVWLGRFTDQPIVVQGLDQELYADFEELHQAREACDQEIIRWATHLSQDWLNQKFQYTNTSGQAYTWPRWILVTHLFNHQTHHRGQLTTLLHQLGYDPGATDLPKMPELSALALQ